MRITIEKTDEVFYEMGWHYFFSANGYLKGEKEFTEVTNWCISNFGYGNDYSTENKRWSERAGGWFIKNKDDAILFELTWVTHEI